MNFAICLPLLSLTDKGGGGESSQWKNKKRKFQCEWRRRREKKSKAKLSILQFCVITIFFLPLFASQPTLAISIFHSEPLSAWLAGWLTLGERENGKLNIVISL
jgi:hypothetical protein